MGQIPSRFSLSMSELGRCTIAEATFPCHPTLVPSIVLRTALIPVPLLCVNEMLEWGIIEKTTKSLG